MVKLEKIPKLLQKWLTANQIGLLIGAAAGTAVTYLGPAYHQVLYYANWPAAVVLGNSFSNLTYIYIVNIILFALGGAVIDSIASSKRDMKIAAIIAVILAVLLLSSNYYRVNVLNQNIDNILLPSTEITVITDENGVPITPAPPPPPTPILPSGGGGGSPPPAPEPTLDFEITITAE